MFKLMYTAKLVQVDNVGNPNGEVYTFSGQQIISSTNPQNADIAAATAAMSTDLTSQIEVGFPVQQAGDSSNDASGGEG